jgi:outer membrane protein assembly factor BamD (BamD/ComL family)
MKKLLIMKKYVLIFIVFIFAFSSCEGPKSESKKDNTEVSLEESIASLEKELFNTSAVRLDRKKALKLISLYEEYVDTYPQDKLAPEYLFKAADISMNMRRPQATIALFDRIIQEYPEYDKSSSALFLKAFVYEDQLQDYENAKINYELFLSKYPDSEFADDAQVSLRNLGKSPEELIKEFEEKAAQ